jgi:hypothetical protein
VLVCKYFWSSPFPQQCIRQQVLLSTTQTAQSSTHSFMFVRHALIPCAIFLHVREHHRGLMSLQHHFLHSIMYITLNCTTTSCYLSKIYISIIKVYYIFFYCIWFTDTLEKTNKQVSTFHNSKFIRGYLQKYETIFTVST